MADHSLHLPIELELTEGVRLLGARLASSDQAIAVTVRLWIDWARQRKVWRPYKMPANVDWAEVALAQLVEQACGWTGQPGALILALLDVGILLQETRESQPGLVLAGFEELNAHLLPGYKSIQQQGGAARAAKLRLRETAEAVPRQMRLAASQGVLNFLETHGIAAEDQDAAIGLLMRLRTACGLPQWETSAYKEMPELVKTALHRARLSTPDEIQSFLLYLMEHEKNPAVPKDPAVILRDWDRLARFALPPSRL